MWYLPAPLQTAVRGLTQPSSACSSSADFICPSPCLFAIVGAAVHLTLLATIVRLAQQQGCWGAEVGRWSLSWPECAGRAEQESAPTFSCETWIWHSTTAWMADDWKWPLHGGAQLAIDTTMVSPLHRDGRARRGAVAHDGAALRQARTRRTYPELAGEGGRARLVVLAAEVGGRWSEETAEFLSSLSWAKVRELPEDLQRDGRKSWLRRWKKLLGCTAAKAFAMSLLDLAPSGSDGAIPSVHEVICEARHS